MNQASLKENRPEVLKFPMSGRYRIQPKLTSPCQVSAVYKNWKKAILGEYANQIITVDELFKASISPEKPSGPRNIIF